MSNMLDLVRRSLAENRTARADALSTAEAIADAASAARRSLTIAEDREAAAALALVAQLDEQHSELLAREAELADITARSEATRNVPGLRIVERRNVRGTDPVRARALDHVERSAVPESWRQAAIRFLENDATGEGARIAAVTADPDYLTAFGKLLREPERGHLDWTPDEHRAFAAVREFERAMSVGTSSAGGYAVPFTLDPSFILTGAGSINPLRRIARVEQTPTKSWNGVSAAQVSASWDAEASEVSDDSPTLSQPAINLHMARVFVPASFEAIDDIPNLGEQVAMLAADAFDNLEATAFVTGSGTAQPKGVVTAVGAVTASRVNPTTGGTYGLPDVYVVQNALPARHSARARWAASLTILNRTRRFGEGSTGSNSAFWTDLGGGVPPELLGRPIYEVSTMSASVTTGQDILLYGDFEKFVIADHVGGTRVELVQNLMGVTNNRPIASRGFFWWRRTGSDVTDADAFRTMRL
jgi:HK97 family phage major capsid protein